MIAVDHAPGSPLTSAERVTLPRVVRDQPKQLAAPQQIFTGVEKIAGALVIGDHVKVNWGAWGDQVMRVDYVAYTDEDSAELTVHAWTAEHSSIERYHARKSVLTYPDIAVGTWV